MTRAQLSSNALRGLSYLPRYQPGAGPDAPSLSVNVRRRIALTGDPVTNVRGNVYPIDVDGDGRYELVQYNGYRFIRVFDQDGNKLWERDNPNGRVHRSFVHRDTMAIVDSDGDGALACGWPGSSRATRRSGGPPRQHLQVPTHV